MDMAFLLRAQRLLADQPAAKLDFAVLTAVLAAQRAAGAAATQPPPVAKNEEALVELLVAGPDWRKAASAQQGCFSRAEAGRRGNGL
ncbi:MAG: hypothetical protein ACXW2T_05315 [Allosphingosinicella sp.]